VAYAGLFGGAVGHGRATRARDGGGGKWSKIRSGYFLTNGGCASGFVTVSFICTGSVFPVDFGRYFTNCVRSIL
jgi:hypothetical protein